MKMSKPKEGNIISFKLVIDQNNKLITELSQFPEDRINDIFVNGDRETIRNALKFAKEKLEPLHAQIQRHLNALG
jgi:hypothetical protein|tara:strand:- start:720 stop:944 length:225 start_codon:yes stop_codon:yes gene_type:complete